MDPTTAIPANADRRALLAVALHACLVLPTVVVIAAFVSTFVYHVEYCDTARLTSNLDVFPHWLRALSEISFFLLSPSGVVVFYTVVVGLLVLDWRFCRNLVRRGAEAGLTWFSCGIAFTSLVALLLVVACTDNYLCSWKNGVRSLQLSRKSIGPGHSCTELQGNVPSRKYPFRGLSRDGTST